MTDGLPTRAFTALSPPPAGAAAAVRGGRGIRRRRRLTGAGAAAASVAVVAGVLVAAGGTSPHASDVLIPADPAPPSVSAGGTPGGPDDSMGSVNGPGARPTSSPTGNPSSPGPTRTQPGQTRASPTGAAAAYVYRTPNLVRRYVPAPTPAGGPSGRICSGGTERDANGNVHNASGFCLAGYAVSTSRGHDLILEVCRDSTGPGSLRFLREIEAELVVHDVGDKDRVVWRWSTGHANEDVMHTLSLETNACWTWTAPWTDVDSRGRELDTGDYAVGVLSRADQLHGMPEQRATFRIS